MVDKKENLMELSVKDLRERLVKMGMPEEDAGEFETKKPLIAAITALRIAGQKAAETPGQLKIEKEKYLSKREIMRVHLMNQPRVRILVPLGSKEKVGVINLVHNKETKREEQVYVSGAYLPVQLNGFKWLIAKGKYQSVPEDIADVISESLNQTTEAGKSHLIDRIDPETGKSVRDRLE